MDFEGKRAPMSQRGSTAPWRRSTWAPTRMRASGPCSTSRRRGRRNAAAFAATAGRRISSAPEIDGVIGPRSQRALNGYRSSRGMAPSDRLDDATFAKLAADARLVTEA